MPSEQRWSRWLGFLGRLLPTAIRQRVFEPACYELALDNIRDRRSSRLLAPRIFAILIYVVAANFPGVLVENRRPSRLGILIGSVGLLSLAILLGIRIALAGMYVSP